MVYIYILFNQKPKENQHANESTKQNKNMGERYPSGSGNNFANAPAWGEKHINEAASTINLWDLSAQPESKGEMEYENCRAAEEESAIQGPLLKSHLWGRISCAFSCFGHLTLAPWSNWSPHLQTN
ncbi:unnamed protein product [Natator depressus]